MMLAAWIALERRSFCTAVRMDLIVTVNKGIGSPDSGYFHEWDELVVLGANLSTTQAPKQARRISCWTASMAAWGRPTTWIGLRHLHVPENRRSELEHVADVLAEGRRLEPFPPRHVGHFAESDFLDLAGELLAFRFIASAHPVGDELLELRDVRPAEPGARARARQAEVYGGIDDVR